MVDEAEMLPSTVRRIELAPVERLVEVALKVISPAPDNTSTREPIPVVTLVPPIRMLPPPVVTVEAPSVKLAAEALRVILPVTVLAVKTTLPAFHVPVPPEEVIRRFPEPLVENVEFEPGWNVVPAVMLTVPP